MSERGYYLRDGSRTDAETWRQKQGTVAYVQVASDRGGGHWVSTIWMGVDDGTLPSPDGRPLIFETVVFREATKAALDRGRWPDEPAARAGHAALRKKWIGEAS